MRLSEFCDEFQDAAYQLPTTLKAQTPKGSIIIKTFKYGSHAIDSDGVTIASTQLKTKAGIDYLKRACRGWYGWNFRLKWKKQ